MRYLLTLAGAAIWPIIYSRRLVISKGIIKHAVNVSLSSIGLLPNNLNMCSYRPTLLVSELKYMQTSRYKTSKLYQRDFRLL